jgi:hypothetical protein
VSEFVEALKLDGGAVAVQQCARSRLIRDDRAFDAEVIRSAVVYSNLLVAGPVLRDDQGQPTRDVPPELVKQIFGWIPDVLSERARLAGVPARSVAWREPDDTEHRNAGAIALTLIGPLRLVARAATFKIEGRALTFAEWMDQALGQLPIYTRYRYLGNHRVRTTSVPLLTGVSACMAYAVASILLDRWKVGFWGRIRECPYVRPLRDGDGGLVRQQNHWFLDFRLGRGRELEKNRQRFCCAEHGNRYKQQRHRETRTARHK